MDRKEQLLFCNQCVNKLFSREKGVICALTHEQANFIGNCDQYKVDDFLAKKIEEKIQKEEEIKLNSETWGLSSLGIKNLIVVGVIFCVLSIIIELCLFYYFRLISLYPLLVLVLSIITIIKGIKKKKKVNNNLLDDHL